MRSGVTEHIRQDKVTEACQYPSLRTAVRQSSGLELFCHQSTSLQALEQPSKRPQVLRIVQRSAHFRLGLQVGDA